MNFLNLFRNARIVLLLLLTTACAPASSITLGEPVPAGVTVEVATVGSPLQPSDKLPPLLPGETRLYATQVALPTYPIEAYQQATFDPTYRWPYLRFDRERFRAEAPPPELRTYKLIVLENRYLEVSILPEVGGRIWQIIHKPTGDTLFYQNSVVKPSPWGPASQLGWLATGGLEWALPVNEHGYAWGTEWQVTTFQGEGQSGEMGSVGVRIATPDNGQLISAEIVVTLEPESAYVSIAPTIRNESLDALDFHFWQTAMLAPGPENELSEELRFVVPGKLMSVHSTGDYMLPGAGQIFTWPSYYGRDLSRLGNWDRYLGFFEYPKAHGPFVGVYDPTLDAGAVRVFPAQIAQGSKVFGLGWRNRIGSEDFTDDNSIYVELHGGLSPTFDEPYHLDGGESVRWEEFWYPVEGIGNLTYADLDVALNLERLESGIRVALYPTRAFSGKLMVLHTGSGEVAAEYALEAAPALAFVRDVPLAPDTPVTVIVRDYMGATLLEYTSLASSSGARAE
jgi:hypothetical protein